MKILYIAPLPPPISGHSLAAQVFCDELKKQHEVEIVDLRKEDLKEGNVTFSRLFQMFKILLSIYRKKKAADVIYLTISETLAGNLRDILIYLLCLRCLPKMVIHLHGGSLGKLLFDKHRSLFKLNCYFIRRVGAVIVLGQSHVSIFSNFMSREKIHVVPNFAGDDLFLDKDDVHTKFQNTAPLNILYLSNLTSEKGYNDLLDAFLALDDGSKSRVAIHFAGLFESEIKEKQFFDKIKEYKQIHYHGVVQGQAKKALLAKAHIFCLPTCLLEGQPISILEAYASGCVVLTTKQGGIADIFKEKTNGYLIMPKRVDSIKMVIEQLLHEPEELVYFALKNREQADADFRTTKYYSSLLNVFLQLKKSSVDRINVSCQNALQEISGTGV